MLCCLSYPWARTNSLMTLSCVTCGTVMPSLHKKTKMLHSKMSLSGPSATCTQKIIVSQRNFWTLRNQNNRRRPGSAALAGCSYAARKLHSNTRPTVIHERMCGIPKPCSRHYPPTQSLPPCRCAPAQYVHTKSNSNRCVRLADQTQIDENPDPHHTWVRPTHPPK